MGDFKIGGAVGHNPDLYAFRRTYPEGLSRDTSGSWYAGWFTFCVACLAGLAFLTLASLNATYHWI